MPSSKKQNKIIRALKGDRIWDELAKKRDNKKARFVSHAKAWKQPTAQA